MGVKTRNFVLLLTAIVFMLVASSVDVQTTSEPSHKEVATSSTLYEPARQRLIRYALIGLIALSLAVVAALVIERSIVLPVRRLRAAAHRLGGGDLSTRAPRLGGGEIGDLGIAFNTMASQIAETRSTTDGAGPIKVGICQQCLSRTQDAFDDHQTVGPPAPAQRCC